MTCSDDATGARDVPPEGDDGARTIAYRRSLRGSRTRRAAAALRRRRIMRGRGSIVVATLGVLIASGGAVAQQRGASSQTLGRDTIAAAQRALGVDADGIVGPRTRAATKRFQRRKKLVVDGVIGPQTLRALGIRTRAAARGARSAKPGSPGDHPVLARIARCESGGNPRAVSRGGRYRGKYQFSRATWRDMGGKGDPAKASEAEQDRRAMKLYRRSGTSPWPSCA